MTNPPKTAIIVELDYKGEYGRYALTREDFTREFPNFPAPAFVEEFKDDTIRPLVHIWYTETEINSPLWKTFFTDLLWGLGETDVENENYAYVDPDQCSESLRAYVEATC